MRSWQDRVGQTGLAFATVQGTRSIQSDQGCRFLVRGLVLASEIALHANRLRLDCKSESYDGLSRLGCPQTSNYTAYSVGRNQAKELRKLQ